jgi:hypothetical protein
MALQARPLFSPSESVSISIAQSLSQSVFNEAIFDCASDTE